MKFKKIPVSAKRLTLEPNLTDYEKEVKRFSFKEPVPLVSYFPRGRINAAYNATTRHMSGWRKNKIALFWEGENASLKFSFTELNNLSNQFGNLLKKKGIKKGDRVFLFLPRIPELYAAFLGILKIGAVAGTLFPAFESQALLDRLGNSSAKIVITSPALVERVKRIKRKLPKLKEIIVVDETFSKILARTDNQLKVCQVRPKDPAFMLYTSATGNTPVCGIVIPHRAIEQQIITGRWVLDLQEEDTYWCTADPGWVTGVVYGILVPWSLGISQVVFEGRFSAKKWYSLIEKYRVSVFYTAPTALRMLARDDREIKKYDLLSLRHILSVGEALPPDLINWSMEKLKLPVHDTWWQTETGAIMIANFPIMDIYPGSMGKPIPGIKAAVVDNAGKKVATGTEGNLAFKPGWPSMMEMIWGNSKLYRSYFKNGWYLSGDRVYQDNKGYYWFVGRAKDIIKTSGERVGPFEVESVLVTHPLVLEAGVIGKPDKLRGEIIKAFIVLKEKVKPNKKLKDEIVTFVKKHLAGHAYPREIEFIDKLPKNRSGKIVRRILKARELGQPVGDTSTLEE